jgi:hypothetical protein
MEDLLVLGDLCANAESFRDISLRALGVGLDGRGTRLVFEAKAELSAEGYCWSRRMLIDESSRLVWGRSG